MFDNNPSLTVSQCFNADQGAVSAALAFARDFIARAPCGPDAEAKLAIVVEELVANVIEHGLAGADSEIHIDIVAIGQDIGLTLTDGGVHFDPRSVASPQDLPPERGGGAGLALVRSWANFVSYERINGRNLLRLIIPQHG
jgi:serine/threonine-protein kinase RsbW